MSMKEYTGDIHTDFATFSSQHERLFTDVMTKIMDELYPHMSKSRRLATRNKLLSCNFEAFCECCREDNVGVRMSMRAGVKFVFAREVWAQFVKEYHATLIVNDNDLVEVLFI